MQIWKDNGEKILFSFTNKEDFVLVDGVIRLSHSVLFFLSTGHELLHFGKLFTGRNVMELILLTWTHFSWLYSSKGILTETPKKTRVNCWLDEQPATNQMKHYEAVPWPQVLWQDLEFFDVWKDMSCYIFWINKMLGYILGIFLSI